MRKFLLLFYSLTTLQAYTQLHFTYCDPATKELRIRNFGASTVNIGGYSLCSNFEYQVLNQAGITINSGDFNLSAGEEVHFTWSDSNVGFQPAANDMGLYQSAAFSNPSEMVDFIQWGAGDQGRENVAVQAGIWIEDVFVPVPGPYYYVGDGSLYGPDQWSQSPPGGDPYTGVRINEVDCDQTGTDAAEFIELFGDPDASLDGLVVVFLQGDDNDESYAAYDLDGYSLNAEGFFLLGNAAVAGVGLVFPDNSMQNGPDGIAIYAGDAADWPDNTPATATGLVDALVYGTDDDDDTGLIATLTPGQLQLNENENNAGVTQSISRVPDGGEAMNTSNYVVQNITPGYTNLPQCQGAQIELSSGVSEQCTEDDNLPLEITNNSSFGSAYIYILADNADNIISVNEDGIIDSDVLGVGTFHIWGLSYTGAINEETTTPGLPVSAILSDACVSMSDNFITVTRTECNAPDCDGGNVLVDDNYTYLSICSDGEEDIYNLANTGTGNANYTYVLTLGNAVQEILDVPTFDFNTLAGGTYFIHGLSYDGSLDAGTIEDGDIYSEILATGSCLDFSTDSIRIDVIVCEEVEGCTELYFSEYLEGSSNNKALEIYNPTPFPADLNDYDIFGYFNGNLSEGPVIALSGTLEPGETYVIANSQADASLLALADITGGLATFNGDDALVLLHNLEPIDVIGVPGEDPGSAWTFGTGSTMDKTLVRQPQVNAPTTNWIQSQGQWLIHPINDFSGIGSHTTFPCTSLAFVGFEETAIAVEETDGTLTFTIQAFNVSVAFDVVIDITGGTATLDEDYSDVFPVTLTFDAENTTQQFTVDILDDTEFENYEYFTMTMTADDDFAAIVNESETVTIEPSDQVYPEYTIALVTDQSTGSGVADSVGVFASIAGIVHGINFNGAGIHFTLIEGEAGIKVFDPDSNFGYTVVEGDSVRVKGEVAQFMGMTEFYPDSIFIIDGGHPLEIPTLLTGPLSEVNESHMLRLECVELADPGQWTNQTNGFDVDVTDGTNTWVMHIDLDTDIYGTDAPDGHFSVTGIGAQFDTTGVPYDEGYTFWPRYLEDIYDEVQASFVQFGDLEYGDNGASVSFINSSIGEIDYNWDFGDGETSTQEFPTHEYSYDFLSTVSEVSITLTVTNEDGCSDSYTYTTDAVYSAISEAMQIPVQLYPNPATSEVTIQATESIRAVSIMDAAGREVLQTQPNGTMPRIDISMLEAGLYHVLIITRSGVQSRKLLKK